ncbi:hypothetical protein A0H81_10183 [Grifola frondosa]|uniref:Uncharacterized protein n=1 Tax=Grifola frondosa TaxID=5627 RepID=A0A1C7LYC7_GRIFR|nr:hypothetical protein A0H81_10183 [Grifola frondosa]
MLYNLATLFLPILALGKAVIANPLHPRAAELTEVSKAPTQFAKAVALGPAVSATGSSNVTAALAGLHSDAARRRFLRTSTSARA